MSMTNTNDKEIDIQQCLPFETAFCLVADEEMGRMKKKDWVEEVGEKKMVAVNHTVMIV